MAEVLRASGHEYAVGWAFNEDLALVAVYKEKVVGFITAWADNRPYAWIDAILVHPDYRGAGVLVFMYDAMEQLLRSRGVKRVWAFTPWDRMAERIAPKRGYVKKADVVLLEKEL